MNTMKTMMAVAAFAPGTGNMLEVADDQVRAKETASRCSLQEKFEKHD